MDLRQEWMAITSNANWSNEPFTLDKMLEAVKRVSQMPRMDGFFGPALLRSLTREPPSERNPLLGRSASFHGIPVQESGAFPFQATCGTCAGTGEGEESTYCPNAKAPERTVTRAWCATADRRSC